MWFVHNERTITSKKSNSALQSALFVFLGLLLVSCSPKYRDLFFDIPPPKPKPEVVVEEQPTTQSSPPQNQTFAQPNLWAGLSPVDPEAGPPPIEEAETWEKALEILPKDYKKKADWSAALEQGVARPVGGADPRALYATMFKYVFIIAAEKPKNEAYFPHSAHTEWLGCKNCHMSLYPYKRNPATMKEMRKGASCGACHGKVAFALKQCKRCHLQR